MFARRQEPIFLASISIYCNHNSITIYLEKTKYVVCTAATAATASRYVNVINLFWKTLIFNGSL